MSYNPFRQILAQNLGQPHQHKIYKILASLTPYLSISDLVTMSMLNSTFNEAVNGIIWKAPKFQKLAYIHDSLYMFNKFIKHVSTVQPSTAKQVQKIDLNKMEESLYERVNPQFFKVLVNHCAEGLEHLDLSRTDFFNARSLPPHTWTLPNLTFLNVSYCSQVNDDMLIKIARGCRNLVQIRLDGLPRHKGQGLACFAAECDKLTSVSVRYNTAMLDESIITLAKFRHVRLLELDLTGCTKVTPVGLDFLARYCAHLQYLSLAQTSCQLQQLKKFICIPNNTKSLDISDLKACEAEELTKWMWESTFKKLVDITIGMTTAIELVKLYQGQLVDTHKRFKTVKRIVLTNLQERTPWTHFVKLLEMFPNATYVTFVRAYFESDFMLGTYRTPSPEAEESITDFKLQSFNLSQSKVVATVIREREDNLDTSLLNW